MEFVCSHSKSWPAERKDSNSYLPSDSVIGCCEGEPLFPSSPCPIPCFSFHAEWTWKRLARFARLHPPVCLLCGASGSPGGLGHPHGHRECSSTYSTPPHPTFMWPPSPQGMDAWSTVLVECTVGISCSAGWNCFCPSVPVRGRVVVIQFHFLGQGWVSGLVCAWNCFSIHPVTNNTYWLQIHLCADWHVVCTCCVCVHGVLA